MTSQWILLVDLSPTQRLGPRNPNFWNVVFPCKNYWITAAKFDNLPGQINECAWSTPPQGCGSPLPKSFYMCSIFIRNVRPSSTVFWVDWQQACITFHPIYGV